MSRVKQRGMPSGWYQAAAATAGRAAFTLTLVCWATWVLPTNAQLLRAHRCEDMAKPLGGLGLPSAYEGISCAQWRAIYGGTCDANLIAKHKICDATCQKNPSFVQTRCPKLCNVCTRQCSDARGDEVLKSKGVTCATMKSASVCHLITQDSKVKAAGVQAMCGCSCPVAVIPTPSPPRRISPQHMLPRSRSSWAIGACKTCRSRGRCARTVVV